MEKDNCGFNESVAVRVSTSSGFWPENNLFYEAHLDTPIHEILKLASEALNLASTDGFVARECQKDLDVTKTFRQSGLRHLIGIHYSKLEKGGGSNPLLSTEIFNREISKLTKNFLQQRNWKLINQNYPNLIIEMNAINREAFIVVANCDSYPSIPPSFTFTNPDNKSLTNIPGITHGGFINLSNHPNTNSAFICAPGAREYHNHPSHTNDRWECYRTRMEEFGLVPMLDKIYNFWLNGGNK